MTTILEQKTQLDYGFGMRSILVPTKYDVLRIKRWLSIVCHSLDLSGIATTLVGSLQVVLGERFF